MPDSSSDRVNCPNCDRSYRWDPSLAGRRVACKQCKKPFRIPDTPGIGVSDAPKPKPEPQPDPLASDGTYDLDLGEGDAPAAPSTPVATKCPGCNNELRPGAVICLNCGFNLKEGKVMAGPQVTALPEEERKEIANELKGMKWVRIGLWIHLLSLLMVVGLFVLSIGAFFSDVLAILVLVLALLTVATGLASSIMCLAAPKQSNTRLVLSASIVFTVISLAVNLLAEFDVVGEAWGLSTFGLDITAKILFLCFFIQLAKYLEFQEIIDRAKKVLGLYVLLIIDAVLMIFGFIGCIFLLMMLAMVIYTIVLYVLLIIDLNNALVYRIAEQEE